MIDRGARYICAMPQSHPIKFLKRHQIDDAKWDRRVEQDPTAPIYSSSWYLDAATNKQWNAIVYEDYAYLLPLPLNFRFFRLPRVVTPPLSQQLGVLTSVNLEEEVIVKERVKAMLKAIPAHYLSVHLKLRLSAYFKGLDRFTPRTNLCIDLSKRSHKEIYANYGRSLKSRLRKASQRYTFQPSQDIDAFMDMFRQEVGPKAKLKEWSYQRMTTILRKCMEKEQGRAYRAVDTHGNVHGQCFFAGRQRIINLMAASSSAGRSGFAMHFLLDSMIAQAIEEGASLFDFEGSELPGVRQFFESFGSEVELYFTYKSGLENWRHKWGI